MRSQASVVVGSMMCFTFFSCLLCAVEASDEPTCCKHPNVEEPQVGGYGCTVNATGKKALTPWVFIWKLRDGNRENGDDAGQRDDDGDDDGEPRPLDENAGKHQVPGTTVVVTTCPGRTF